MARPCGCTGGVVATGTNGVCTTGAGSIDNPLAIGLCNPMTGQGCDSIMGCVGSRIGAGLNYSANLGVKLAVGGGLDFDAAGGVKLSGTTPPAPTPGNLNIPALEQRRHHVMVGALGAGYHVQPECLLKSFTYGYQQGLDAMQVPVRFLFDGTPVVYTDEFLGRTSGELQFDNLSYWRTQEVQVQTPERWQHIVSEPGAYNQRAAWQPPGDVDPYGLDAFIPRWNALFDPDNRYGDRGDKAWSQTQVHPYLAGIGWFGYMAENQYGLTYLGDVLREVGGKVPLILQLLWPSTIQDPNKTPTWRTYFFLNKVLAQIQNSGLRDFVAVTSNPTQIPGLSGTTTNVLDQFSAAGIRVGPVINNPTDAAAHPPNNTWPASWTWAILDQTLPDATITPYVTKGIFCLLNHVHRQYLGPRVDTLAPLGVISGDPHYMAAGIPNFPGNHPLGFAGYRHMTSQWSFLGVDHGVFPSADDSIFNVSAERRGQLRAGREYIPGEEGYFLNPLMSGPRQGIQYWVLQGWCGPNPTPTNYSYDWSWQFHQLSPAGSNRDGEILALAFAVPTDHDFADWSFSFPPANRPLDTGYVLWLTQASNIYLMEYTAGRGQTIASGVLPTTIASDLSPRHLRIGINQYGIRLQVQDLANPNVWHQIFSTTASAATSHRGFYTYFGTSSAYADANPGTGKWWSAVYSFQLWAGRGDIDGPPRPTFAVAESAEPTPAEVPWIMSQPLIKGVHYDTDPDDVRAWSQHRYGRDVITSGATKASP